MAVKPVTEPVFFDTSILLSGIVEIGPDGDAAQALMSAVASGRLRNPKTAWHCCLEFYSVATRLPEGLRLSPLDALRLVKDEIFDRFEILQLPEKRHGAFLDTAAKEGIGGGRIYDAHIAEIARAADLKTVVTDNRRHFTILLRHGIRVMTAAEFLSEL